MAMEPQCVHTIDLGDGWTIDRSRWDYARLRQLAASEGLTAEEWL